MVQRVLDIYQEYRGEWSSVCWISIRNTGVSGPACAGYLSGIQGCECEWSSVCWISIRNTGVSGPVCAGYLSGIQG